jgi:hypothetical protein
VMVVSFMIVIPFSLGFVLVRFDRTARTKLIGRGTVRPADSSRTLHEHGPASHSRRIGHGVGFRHRYG